MARAFRCTLSRSFVGEKMQDPTQSGIVWRAPQGLLRPHQAVHGQFGANVAVCVDPRGGAVVTAGWADESGLDLWAGLPLELVQAITVAAEPGDEGVALPDWSLPEAARHASPIHSHLQPVTDAAMAARAARMVVCAGRTLHIYDFPTPGSGFHHAGALEGHPDAVVRTGISSDGLRVAAAMPSGEVWLWDVSNLRVLHRLTQTQHPYWVGFLWNDLLAGVGDGSGRVVLWEAASGRRHMQFDAHAGPVLGVVASSERGALLTFGSDGVARQWDLDEGRQISRDIVHGAPICSASYAAGGKAVVTLDASGRLLVTASADGTLLDWVQLEPAPGARLTVDRTTSAIWVGSERSLLAVDADWTALLAQRAAQRNSGRFAALPATRPMRPAKATVRIDLPAPPAQVPASPSAPPAPFLGRPVESAGPASASATAQLPSVSASGAWQPRDPERFRTGADSIVGRAPVPLLAHGARMLQTGNEAALVAPVADSVPPPVYRPPPPVAFSRPPAPSSAGSPPSSGTSRREPAPLSMVDQIRASQILWQESANRSRREVRNTLIAAILAGLIAAGVTWHHFTERAVPAAVQTELDRAEQNQAQTVAQANAEFENYQREQRAASARYREDKALLPTELERLQRITERRIEERRARRDQTILEGQARLQVAQTELSARRAVLAKRLALTGGLIIAAAAALLAFLVQLGTREKPVKRLDVRRR